MTAIKIPKKLIEVALPLDAINAAASREKSIRHGHPSTLHLWWARRPLAAARAVIFAQMVNDPGYQQGNGFKYGVNKEKATQERERLFGIMRDLVTWENSNNPEVLARARAEIVRSWQETCELNKDHPQAEELFNPQQLPAFHDPFAGGGAIPLEAQRLGLSSHASDLNPVAVTINKAMIEIPPRFAGFTPVGPESQVGKNKKALFKQHWPHATGLAEDVRRYGEWMRTQAQQRIGHLYPKIAVTATMAAERPDLAALVGTELTVIAYIWARTVKSPNPAYAHIAVPLISTYVLSSKAGNEAYLEPVLLSDGYMFKVRRGKPPESAHAGTAAGKRAGFICLLSGTPLDYPYIRKAGIAGQMGNQLLAIVAEGAKGRVYLDASPEQQALAESAQVDWKPNVVLHGKCRVNVSNYGLDKFSDLFTNRQLLALTTFSDLIPQAIDQCYQAAKAAGLPDDGQSLDAGGTGALAYAQAVGVYLAFGLQKCADYWNSICSWHNSGEKIGHMFNKQAIPMTWDYVEANPFSSASGNWTGMSVWSIRVIEHSQHPTSGFANQADAQTQSISQNKIISTDPPYYDNIGYADLSDFFYIWLRKSLKSVFPSLYTTLTVPKAEELVATPYRHGSKEAAEQFFLTGMTQAMQNLAQQAHPAFPVTIYYAFKQAETKAGSTSSTGWVTFLEAVLAAGLAITGTWPMRTEMSNRMIGMGSNALASSVVLVCKKRQKGAGSISRRQFIRELNATLPEALLAMTHGDVHSPIAPVDLSQAIIGPGMAIFSQYDAVLEANGDRMSVKTALELINHQLNSDDFDTDTQFCLAWFEEHSWNTHNYGDADTLARAKGTSVGGLQNAGVLDSGSGSVRLRRYTELPQNWNPENDDRTPTWEALHQLIRTLYQNGEIASGALLARMPDRIDAVRSLAYRLYTLCERKNWAEDARSYNALINAWSGIEQAASTVVLPGSQPTLDF